jgi:hypothetical protein
MDPNRLTWKKGSLWAFHELESYMFFRYPLYKIVPAMIYGFDATERAEDALYDMYKDRENILRTRASLLEASRQILLIPSPLTLTGLSDENIEAIQNAIDALPASNSYKRSVQEDLDTIKCPIYLTLIQQPITVTSTDKTFSRAYEYEAFRRLVSFNLGIEKPAINPATNEPLTNYRIHAGPTPSFTSARTRVQSIADDMTAFNLKIQVLLSEEEKKLKEQITLEKKQESKEQIILEKKQDASPTEKNRGCFDWLRHTLWGNTTVSAAPNPAPHPTPAPAPSNPLIP